MRGPDTRHAHEHESSSRIQSCAWRNVGLCELADSCRWRLVRVHLAAQQRTNPTTTASNSSSCRRCFSFAYLLLLRLLSLHSNFTPPPPRPFPTHTNSPVLWDNGQLETIHLPSPTTTTPSFTSTSTTTTVARIHTHCSSTTTRELRNPSPHPRWVSAASAPRRRLCSASRSAFSQRACRVWVCRYSASRT